MLRHIRSAFAASWKAVANGPGQSVFVAALSFLGGPLTIAYQNRSSGQQMTVALSNWWSSVRLGISYILAAAAILFVWNLICAPYKEQKARADRLEARLNAVTDRTSFGGETREALETFARRMFDPVYALAVRAVLAINAQTEWPGYPEGKVSTEQEHKQKLSRRPSNVIARAETFVAAQEKFMQLLAEYEDLPSTMHVHPMIGCPPLETFPEYREWRAADPSFVEAVRKFVVLPGYSVLNEEVPLDWGEAMREGWPSLSSPAAAS